MKKVTVIAELEINTKDKKETREYIEDLFESGKGTKLKKVKIIYR